MKILAGLIIFTAYMLALTIRIVAIAAPFVLAAWAIKHFIF